MDQFSLDNKATKELFTVGRMSVEEVIDLIQKGADVNAVNEDENWTPLMYAAKENLILMYKFFKMV